MKDDKPEEGQWYWVRFKNTRSWWPALHDPAFAGGWGNCDTWEDFQRDVVEWSLIHPPVKYTVVKRSDGR